MKTSLLPTLALALILSGPAFAQSSGSSSQAAGSSTVQSDTQHSGSSAQSAQNAGQSSQSGQDQTKQNNLLTINKLKQDLQNAGFKDVTVLAESFVVQAKDKDGNPTVISLSPHGVTAFTALTQQRQAKASSSGSSGSDIQRR
jgi:hypothetical protein